MTSQTAARHVPEMGPAALSLLVHGAVLLLVLLAFGTARPLARAATRTMPTIVLGADLPKPALAQVPPPAPLRAVRRVVRAPAPPARAVAELGDTPAPAQQASPALAATASEEAPPSPPSEAPPAATEAPVATSGPAAPPPLLYLAEVSRLIRLRLDYPAQARQDRARGTAVVHILLARDGTVLEVALIQGAGHPALDAEAREVVLRIHKFPELPEYYARGEQRFAIDQPIGFLGG